MRALMVLAAACGGSALDGPNDLPNGCPSPRSRYKTDVAQQATMDFTPLRHVVAQRQSILTQVCSCRMPPEGEPAPSAPERALLLGWLTCGSPTN